MSDKKRKSLKKFVVPKDISIKDAMRSMDKSAEKILFDSVKLHPRLGVDVDIETLFGLQIRFGLTPIDVILFHEVLLHTVFTLICDYQESALVKELSDIAHSHIRKASVIR